jgi:hypothetical protein
MMNFEWRRGRGARAEAQRRGGEEGVRNYEFWILNEEEEEVRGQRSEVRGQRSEVRGQRGRA